MGIDMRGYKVRLRCLLLGLMMEVEGEKRRSFLDGVEESKMVNFFRLAWSGLVCGSGLPALVRFSVSVVLVWLVVGGETPNGRAWC